ncbi:uncharacterized protein SCHCODRAFT_02746949 [Schizophyllum commune H4-8]|nr:uncharacterized protein SCHCODRAFT_02746949 [Schizophyllum commune H4-8]KAI5895666.1 hypothetical protein SCHCODRAFT_02746949 [Schizophyllum commune H4-8]
MYRSSRSADAGWSVVTLGTYTYQGRPRQNSDAGPTFSSGGLSGSRNDGRAWRARSMSMPETPTGIDGEHRREYWVSRLQTIDDCTLNSKKSHDSRQSFDCRAVAGRRIKTHSWFDRLDEEVAAEVSARHAELGEPSTPPSHDDESSFVPLSPRQTTSPMAIRGYASTGEIENWDDAYDFEDAEDDWVDIPTPHAPTFGVSARAH